MIRTQGCWDATVRIVLGPVVALVVLVAAGALWLVGEEAAREVVERRPRSDVLTEK
ncbi:hypothetical protein Halar_2686 [halophilic archaeon DL31]|nr:hypothetical protein Halar_2686 [halophilic archaeon DL31]